MSKQDKDGEKKPIKVTFAEGCFDDFEGTQEELDEIVAQISGMVQSGELLEYGIDLTDFESLDLDISPEDVAAMTERAVAASEQYGFDQEGYVKFPFTSNTRH